MGQGQGAQSLWMTLKGYANHDREVYFITSNKHKDSIYDVHPNIHIVRYDAHWLKRGLRYRKIGFVVGVVWWLVFQLVTLFLAIKTIRRERLKVDLVYAYEIMAVPVARVLSLLLRVPMVSRFQGTILYPWLGRRFWRLRNWQHLLAFRTSTDLIIMANDGTRGDTVLNTLGVDTKRVRFWMNGVDKDICECLDFDETQLRKKLCINKETKILLMLSRLVGWKRVDRALMALPEVLAQHHNIMLISIGDGPERSQLEALTRKLQIQDHVRFLGALPHQEIGPYLKVADIFLSLYDLSNVGNPLLEAMACGKCIVTLNTGDTDRLIHNGENGVLLEIDHLPQLPRVICGLLEDAEMRRELGQRAEEFALNNFWTWEERMQEEVTLVEEIVAEHENV